MPRARRPAPLGGHMQHKVSPGITRGSVGSGCQRGGSPRAATAHPSPAMSIPGRGAPASLGSGTAAAHTGWSPGAAVTGSVGRECRQHCRQLPARRREAGGALDPRHEAPARCGWPLGFAPGETRVPSLLRWPDPAHQQPGPGAAPGRRCGRIGPGAICSARSGW